MTTMTKTSSLRDSIGNWRSRIGFWLAGRKSVEALTSALGDPGGGYIDVWGIEPAPSQAKLVKSFKATAYACANICAQGLASVPLRLYVVTGTKQKKTRWPTKGIGGKRFKALETNPAFRIKARQGEVEEVTDHPLLDLLERVNVELDAFSLMEITDLYQEVVGITYWYVPRNSLGVPEAIWLLQPQHVKAKQNDAGELISYEYGSGIKKQTLPAEEVLPFFFPNLENPYSSGYSPMRAAYEAVMLQEKNAAHHAALLKNNARPDMLLSAKEGFGGLGEPESERLERRFRRKFREGGSGGIMVVGDQVDMKPLTYPPKDMQSFLIDDRARRTVANCFGVPLSLLQTENVNLANAQAGQYQLAKYAILPRCRRFEQRLTQRFLPMWDNSGRFFLAFDNPVPEDREFLLRKRGEDMKNGALTINEARAEDGRDPIDKGDRPLLPMNLLPLGLPVSMPPPSPPEKTKTIKRQFARRLPQGTALAETLRQQFRRQKSDMLKRFKAITKTYWVPPEGLFDNADWAAWDREMASASRGHLIAYADDGVMFTKRQLIDRFPGEFSKWTVPPVKIEEAMGRASMAFCRETNVTTRLALDKAVVELRSELIEGIVSGETAQGALTQRVNAIFQDAETYRAQRVAVTETSNAIHEGERIAAIESNVAKGFDWILSADACEICQEIARSQPRVNLNEPFAIKGTGAHSVVMHPPAHPGGQCSMGVVF